MVDRTSSAFRLSRLSQALSALFADGLIGLIRVYQLCISPYFPPRCRFYPSCSAYALEAVKMHGVWRGGYLSVHRICRCNPWGSGGYDPVPGQIDKKLKQSNP